MLDIRKKIELHNSLQIYIPDIVNGGDVLIGQVYFTVTDGINVHIQKDIWNSELYEKFKDEIEQQVFIFEQETKAMCQNFETTIEPNTDTSVLTNMVTELQDENEQLKISNEELKQSVTYLNDVTDDLTITVLDLTMNILGGL